MQQSAHDALLKLSEHETAVRDTAVGEYARLPAWYAYIEFEEQRGAPRNRLRALYERAIVKFFLVGELWSRAATSLSCLWSPTDRIVVRLHERAVRNVAWSSAYWRALVDCLVRADASPTNVNATLERALNVTLGSLADYVVMFDVAIEYALQRLRIAIAASAPLDELVAHIGAVRDWCSRASTCYAGNMRADANTAQAALLAVALLRARIEGQLIAKLEPTVVAAAAESASAPTVEQI